MRNHSCKKGWIFLGQGHVNASLVRSLG